VAAVRQAPRARPPRDRRVRRLPRRSSISRGHRAMCPIAGSAWHVHAAGPSGNRRWFSQRAKAFINGIPERMSGLVEPLAAPRFPLRDFATSSAGLARRQSFPCSADLDLGDGKNDAYRPSRLRLHGSRTSLTPPRSSRTWCPVAFSKRRYQTPYSLAESRRADHLISAALAIPANMTTLAVKADSKKKFHRHTPHLLALSRSHPLPAWRGIAHLTSRRNRPACSPGVRVHALSRPANFLHAPRIHFAT